MPISCFLFSFYHSIICISTPPQPNITQPPFYFSLSPSSNTNTNPILDSQNMAACESLQRIFDNSLPEKSTLLETLSSWNQIKPAKHDDKSFIEMFGELHFKERSPSSSSSSSSSPSFPIPSSSSSSLQDLYPRNNNSPHVENGKRSPLDSFLCTPKNKYTSCHSKSDSFSSMNSESLQLCTEGLGFESSDDVEDLKSEISEDWQSQQDKVSIAKNSPSDNPGGEFRRARTSGGAFPPPISCIGKSGKPWVCFKSYRHDGRFVLKEVRMPSQEFLHACREDGRLRLQFVQPNDDILEFEEEDYEDDEELQDVEIDEDEENEGVEEEEKEADT